MGEGRGRWRWQGRGVYGKVGHGRARARCGGWGCRGERWVRDPARGTAGIAAPLLRAPPFARWRPEPRRPGASRRLVRERAPPGEQVGAHRRPDIAQRSTHRHMKYMPQHGGRWISPCSPQGEANPAGPHLAGGGWALHLRHGDYDDAGSRGRHTALRITAGSSESPRAQHRLDPLGQIPRARAQGAGSRQISRPGADLEDNGSIALLPTGQFPHRCITSR